MGTATNIGGQQIIGKYRTILTNFNLANVKAGSLLPGIYEGLEVQRLSNDTINIGTGVVEYKDSNVGLQIRAAFTSDITHTCSQSNPYVILQYSYSALDEWYIEIRNADATYISTHTDVIIVCKTMWDGVGPYTLKSGVNAFDLTERSDARYCTFSTYALDGTKDGSNKTFTLPSNFPQINKNQFCLSYNGINLYLTTDYTISARTITLHPTDVEAPASTDDLRAVLIKH